MSSVDNPVLELRTFYELEKASKLEVMHFFINFGLIAKEVVCPKCGRPMKLKLVNDSKDGYKWACRRNNSQDKHVASKSIRCGSFFGGSKLKMTTIMILTYLWVLHLPMHYICLQAKVNDNTVTEWIQFCRDVCLEICIGNSEIIGGPDVVVEVNESKFGRRKFSHGQKGNGKWVYCGVERVSKKAFFKIVECQSKDDLLDIIKEFILPGTIIVSSCWKKYDCLEDDAYIKLRDYDAYKFRHPGTNSDDNSKKESICAVVKRSLRTKRMVDNQFPSYLAEYIWRKKNKEIDEEKLLDVFLEDVKRIYIPGVTQAEEKEQQDSS